MAPDLDAYDGREQTYIKHLFLIKYLESAAYKIFQGRTQVFNFVDAFAGPWKITDKKNYSDSSFNLAINTLKNVKGVLHKNGKQGLKIRFCLCEKDQSRVDELTSYATNFPNFDIHVFSGKFEDNLQNIASVCRGGFTFTFIDPTSWNVDTTPIFRFLENQNGEFLFNFISEEINRHATYSGVSKSFGRFLASPDWEAEFNQLPDGLCNEEKILLILKKKIKNSRAATFLPNMPILKPGENRIKMRLVLGTHSPKGVEVFRHVQETVKRTEADTRSELAKGGLFSPEMRQEIFKNAAEVGTNEIIKNAKPFTLSLIQNARVAQKFSELAPLVMERFDLRITHVKKLFQELKSEGSVNYSLPPRKKLPQQDTVINIA